MSNIFEALQRAEAERSGGDAPKVADSVADLLRGVEQEIERERSLTELPTELPPVAKPQAPAAEAFLPTKTIVPDVYKRQGHTFGTVGRGCRTMQWANPLFRFAMTVVYTVATL